MKVNQNNMNLAKASVRGVGAENVPKLLNDIGELAKQVLEKIPREPPDQPITFDTIENFRTRMHSIIIISRPGVIANMIKKPFPIQYTCDDILLVEYDEVAHDVPQVVLSKGNEQVLNFVDQKNGIIILE